MMIVQSTFKYAHAAYPSSLIGVIILVATTCGPPPPPFEAFVINCSDNSAEDICVANQFCDDVYSPAQMCAFHWGGVDQVNNTNLFPNASKGGTCDPNNPPPVEAYYPCWQNEHPYPNTSNPDTSAGNTSNEPTTGEPTTGGEEPKKSYLCTTAPDERFFYWRYGTETEAQAIALGSLRKESWGEPADLPKVYCYFGTFQGAVDACVSKCKADWENRVDGLSGNKAYIWGASDQWGPSQPVPTTPPVEYTGSGDCDLIGSMVIEEVAPYGCLGQAGILPAWDGMTPLTNFLATVMFTGADGGNTSQSDVRGYLAFKVENCGDTSCDLTINALEFSSQDFSGFYTSPDGSQSSYAIDGLELRMEKELKGQWYMARGSVVFPTDVAAGKVWARAATIDGASLGEFSSLFEIDQISGTYRGGILSLSLTQAQNSSALSVTLSTQ